MSWIALLLGLLLALAGAAGLAASIDLLTTEVGLVYAACGAIAVSGGVVTIAIGLLIRRVDALRWAPSFAREVREEPALRAMERAEPEAPAPVAAAEPIVPNDLGAPGLLEAPPLAAVEPEAEPAPELPATPPAAAPEVDSAPPSAPEVAPINENRKGALPGLDTLEEAITPAPAKAAGPPVSLIGRYSAGGADYSIYSDGSIEAQTSQGEFKFASMREFKEFISAKKG